MAGVAGLIGTRQLPVYLVDTVAYKPPEELKVYKRDMEVHGKEWAVYSPELAAFLRKVHEKSGLSDEATYLPPTLHPVHVKEPKTDMESAKAEAEMVMFGAVSELLQKTGLKSTDIDILVTTCSIYCPTPSMSSMIVNHFKMRPDIQSYHLGGMGCGNGVIAIGLIKDLLQAHPNSNAIFVASEITTYCYYPGKEKSRLVPNVIFRMGGAASLLTNKAASRRTAKYRLLHNVRVHTGADDDAFRCMSWGPDAEGINGVYLSRDVVKHAGGALKQCMRTVTPRILTWRQLGEAAIHEGLRRLKGDGRPEYFPDYTKCIDHFAIHAGGYAVLKGIQNGLKLPEDKMVPSFAALREYGNTSCSTTWYILTYLETCGDVRAGQRIMQIGMGGGMKAGVNVWEALRDVKEVHTAWRHLADKPLTAADMPRSIEAIDENTPTGPNPNRKRAREGETVNIGHANGASAKGVDGTASTANKAHANEVVATAPEEHMADANGVGSTAVKEEMSEVTADALNATCNGGRMAAEPAGEEMACCPPQEDAILRGQVAF